jgi:hypothetical protein
MVYVTRGSSSRGLLASGWHGGQRLVSQGTDRLHLTTPGTALTNRNDPRLGAVHEVRIGPADVGSRVSLRRVLRDGRDGLGDVVGDLVSWREGAVVVRRRSGEEETIAEADVIAGKRVPPAPVRPRRDVS